MHGREALQLHASYGRNYIAPYLSAIGLVSALPNASPYRGLKPPLQVFSHRLPVSTEDESAISIRYRPCEFLARFFPRLARDVASLWTCDRVDGVAASVADFLPVLLVLVYRSLAVAPLLAHSTPLPTSPTTIV